MDTNKVDITKLKVPYNHVLIKPDDDFEQYNSGLFVGDDPGSQAKHFSVRGRVYGLPDELLFNGGRLKYYQKHTLCDRDGLEMIGTLKHSSCMFDVDNELNIGDIVFFQYLEHFSSYKEGRFVETEVGDMLLMKYDSLIMRASKETPTDFHMLNGMVLVEPFKHKTVVDGGIEMIVHPGNVYRPVLKDADRFVKSKKLQLGIVREVGSKCNGYLEFLHQSPDPDIHKGQIVLYHPAYAMRLEVHYHNILKNGSNLFRMNRKDIQMIFEFNNAEEEQEMLSIVSEWLTLKK